MHNQDSSAPALFRYDDDTEVRVVTIDGEPWFVLADLCTALGIANVGNVADRLDELNIRRADVENSRGQMRQTLITNEPGMYEVVLRSDKPQAVDFRRWLTGTVLPQIRKTGSYNTAPALPSTRELAQMVIDAEDRADAEAAARTKAEKKLDVEQKRRAAIEGGDGIDLTTFGKKYFSEVRKTDFDKHLYERGYLINQLGTRTRADGTPGNGPDHRKPTAKGRTYIYAHDTGSHGGRRRFTPRVRPQQEIALRDQLGSEGLPVNEHSSGLVLLTAADMKELGA